MSLGPASTGYFSNGDARLSVACHAGRYGPSHEGSARDEWSWWLAWHGFQKCKSDSKEQCMVLLCSPLTYNSDRWNIVLGSFTSSHFFFRLSVIYCLQQFLVSAEINWQGRKRRNVCFESRKKEENKGKMYHREHKFFDTEEINYTQLILINSQLT